MKLGDCSIYATKPGVQQTFFDRRHKIYAFFRERIFRDHTEEIKQAIFPDGCPRNGIRVMELGCGPGFYTCRLAKLFPQIQAIGVDKSLRLLELARSRAQASHLENCDFSQGDACALHHITESIDAVVVSRLFLMVRDRETVLSEIFRVLKPGGRCFVAEPTTRFRTRLPLWTMRISAALNGESTAVGPVLRLAEVMSPQQFSVLIQSQPWQQIVMMHRNGYQYAVCIKDHKKELRVADMETIQRSVTLV